MTTIPGASGATPREAAAGSGTGHGGFTHLHVHTEFSKLDGLSRLREAIRAVKADGQNALAMTDHGTMAGAWRFRNLCAEEGIKPIFGCEMYMALVPDGSDGGQALDPLDPGVRFAKFSRTGMDAETGAAKRQANNHLTVLAANRAGWRNLCALSNAAQHSFYGKPLIDFALLREHAEGLIVLSGCLGGPVASHVAAGDLEQARTNLGLLVECVGQQNVYVEVMEHGLSAEGPEHIRALFGLARDAGVEVVATNDSHYTRDCDADAHDSWLVLAQSQGNSSKKVTKADPQRWKFNGSGYWLRTEEQMRDLYPSSGSWQQACTNTVKLAERVEEDVIPFKSLRLPVFPVPADVVARWEAAQTADRGCRFGTASAFLLHEKVRVGALERYGSIEAGSALAERLRFEEDTINRMGLADYFLIVADVIEWARSERGIPGPDGAATASKAPIQVGPGRGSAGGSVLSYCLGIVDVEPLANGLLFERFLDPERIGMPDIDVDFEARRQEEIFDYVAARYGVDRVARIGSFQNAKTKRAIKDAARVLEFSLLSQRLADLVPVEGGEPHTFAHLFEETLDEDGAKISNPQGSQFRAAYAEDERVRRVVDLARAFEGTAAGESIHPAGVIISDEPLTDLIPLRWAHADGEAVGVPISLWDGVDIDSFGMLKLDALVLRNLDIAAEAIANIEHTTGERISLRSVNPGSGTHASGSANHVAEPARIPDPGDSTNPKVRKAFALLRAGRTAGVFQLESPGMTDLCTAVAPNCLEDLSALVALYRPGPMGADMHTAYADRKNGRAAVDYAIFTEDPAEQEVIESVLGETHGVIVFQEQVMALADKVAAFAPAEKNKLRKAFSKKKKKLMDEVRVIFFERGVLSLRPDGGTKVPFDSETLEKLWVTFAASARYLFNKSHSATYGYLAYVTAYLKANWPTEYGAAVLASTKDPSRRRAVLSALAAEGTVVLPPSLKHSGWVTRPDPEEPGAIRYGLGEIRDVGAVARAIFAERENRGPFANLGDMVARVRVTGENDSAVSVSVSVVEGLVESGACDEFGPRLGHMMVARALAADPAMPVPDAEWGALERANRQRHRLGVFVGTHPVETYHETLVSCGEDTAQTRIDNPGRPDDHESVSTPPVLVDDVLAGDRTGHSNVLGLLTSWTEKTTRQGKRMANFVLQGVHGDIEAVVFPSTFATWVQEGWVPAEGQFVSVYGNVRKTRAFQREEDSEEVPREVTELVADEPVTVPVINDPVYGRLTAPAEAPPGVAADAAGHPPTYLDRLHAIKVLDTVTPRHRAASKSVSKPGATTAAKAPETAADPTGASAGHASVGNVVDFAMHRRSRARGIEPGMVGEAGPAGEPNTAVVVPPGIDLDGSGVAEASILAVSRDSRALRPRDAVRPIRGMPDDASAWGSHLRAWLQSEHTKTTLDVVAVWIMLNKVCNAAIDAFAAGSPRLPGIRGDRVEGVDPGDPSVDLLIAVSGTCTCHYANSADGFAELNDLVARAAGGSDQNETGEDAVCRGGCEQRMLYIHCSARTGDRSESDLLNEVRSASAIPRGSWTCLTDLDLATRAALSGAQRAPASDTDRAVFARSFVRALRPSEGQTSAETETRVDPNTDAGPRTRILDERERQS